jgi:2,4-dienoyl-CoA reductase-like NADH-dependent reductase (Old Yellow Enzyme family)
MITPQTAKAAGLLDPLSVGALQLPNRVIMSPLTFYVALPDAGYTDYPTLTTI